MPEPLLLAVLEVDHEQRVRCQAPGCGRAVHRRIHVVKLDGQSQVFGEDCCARLFGWDKVKPSPHLAAAQGRRLTATERDQLVANTEAFLADLANTLEHERLAALSKLQKLRSLADHSRLPPASSLQQQGRFRFGERPAPPKPSPEVLAEALRRMKLRWDLDESQSLAPGWSSMLRDVIAEVQREG